VSKHIAHLLILNCIQLLFEAISSVISIVDEIYTLWKCKGCESTPYYIIICKASFNGTNTKTLSNINKVSLLNHASQIWIPDLYGGVFIIVYILNTFYFNLAFKSQKSNYA
jgi:hypothetical protein